jgi:hypothetical protein
VGPYQRLGGCTFLTRGLLPATGVLYFFIIAGYDAEVGGCKLPNSDPMLMASMASTLQPII